MSEEIPQEIVEAAARAIAALAYKEDCTLADMQFDEKDCAEYAKANWSIFANHTRAALAAVWPMMVEAEREDCAQIAMLDGDDAGPRIARAIRARKDAP